jgi:hypothetical protein
MPALVALRFCGLDLGVVRLALVVLFHNCLCPPAGLLASDFGGLRLAKLFYWCLFCAVVAALNGLLLAVIS